MAETRSLRDFVCPSCSAQARLDPRFVSWCTECGHGADPRPPELSKRQLRVAEREVTRSKRLFDSLLGAESLRPTSATGVSVTALSTVVNVIAIAPLVLSILFAVHEDGGFWPDAIAALGAAVTWVVRPRLLTRKPKAKGYDRAKAPALYAVLDRCAAELGCQAPDAVFFTARTNASTTRLGLRRRRYISIGVPLWVMLTGPQRVALLGHELGHQVNGDTSHGLWAGAAKRSVHEWTKLLDPRQTAYERRANRRNARMGRVGIAALLAPIVMAVVSAPFFLAALGCRTLLTRLDLYCGQRAEYLADELGARLAGTDAVCGLMATLALTEPVGGYVTAARNDPARRKQPELLWDRLLEYLDSVPETERQRRTIVDRLRNTRTDRSHPANHLRMALLRNRPQHRGVIEVSDEEWAAIDAELTVPRLVAAKALLAGI